MASKKNKTEEEVEIEKQLKTLNASAKMLTNTLEEAKKRKRDNKTLNLIKNAIADNYEQMAMLDPNLRGKLDSLHLMDSDNKKKIKKEEPKQEFDFGDDSNNVSEEKNVIISDENKSIVDIAIRDAKKSFNFQEESDKGVDERVKEENTSYYFDLKDANLSYDVIPLPSKGEVYREKIPKLSVAYLTAESENLITSPHLYKDDLIIDALLKYHVLNKGFDTDKLISGDVDAIMLWLRATGYGPEYPIVVTDPKTGTEFEAKVDLTKIKIKDFNLKGDEDGYFDFTLPISKQVVKFRYLSRKEEQSLTKLNKIENEEARNSMAKQDFYSLKQCLDDDNKLDKEEKDEITNLLNQIEEKWINSEESSNKIKVNRTITNRLEMSIMSIGGNNDKEYIRNFIRKMPALDSLKLRRYIEENRPMVDWNIDIERPQSLGGGSVSIFLEWGADAFLNIV